MNLTSCLKCDSKCMLLECLKNPLICIRLATEYLQGGGGGKCGGVFILNFQIVILVVMLKKTNNLMCAGS